jgi:hypothetical protein
MIGEGTHPAALSNPFRLKMIRTRDADPIYAVYKGARPIMT